MGLAPQIEKPTSGARASRPERRKSGRSWTGGFGGQKGSPVGGVGRQKKVWTLKSTPHSATQGVDPSILLPGSFVGVS